MVDSVLDQLRGLMERYPLVLSDKNEVERLYALVLGKRFVRTSCNDCYKDAIVEMYSYLKKNGKMKEVSSYRLKNGVLLQPEFGSSQFYTNDNLTDEAAEKYLAAHPEKSVWFSELPNDYLERIKNRESGEADKLVSSIVSDLDKGDSEEDIKARYKGSVIGGKRVNNKALSSYVEEAKKQIEG